LHGIFNIGIPNKIEDLQMQEISPSPSPAATRVAHPPCSPVIPAGLPSIKQAVAIRERVSASGLAYIGMQDERHTVGKVIYLFNILDPLHWRYKSTVSYVERV
jgi:hypothetical protein